MHTKDERQIIKETLFKLYQIMAEPTLLCGCEKWTVWEKQERNETANTDFWRSLAGCTW